MTATVAFLERMMAERPSPGDWVYLNNFAEPHRPKPVGVPAGEVLTVEQGDCVRRHGTIFARRHDRAGDIGQSICVAQPKPR